MIFLVTVLMMTNINYVNSNSTCLCVHGECIIEGINNECLCEYGWDGILCDHKICEPSIDCYSSLGHGVCNDDLGECQCNFPWLGYVCNVKYCYDLINCNYGICITEQVSFTEQESYCVCADGWEGEFCDTPICRNIPENSICTFPPRQYNCVGNWTGDNCDVMKSEIDENIEEEEGEGEEENIEEVDDGEGETDTRGGEVNDMMMTNILVGVLSLVIGVSIIGTVLFLAKRRSKRDVNIEHSNSIGEPIQM